MPRILADFLLLLVTLIWGTTFIIVKNAIEAIGPLTFVGVRFFIGGVVLLPWYAISLVRKRRRLAQRADNTWNLAPVHDGRSRRLLWLGALATGFALTFSYITQTFGLLYVPAGKAAFITGLSVVLVPVISSLVLKERPGPKAAAGAVMAALGLGFMSLKPPFGLAMGDFLVFLCALGFAAHIILVGRFSEKLDPTLFAATQLFTVAAGSLLLAVVLERPFSVPIHSWGAIWFTGLLATAGAFLIQSSVQRYTSASHTALIFAAEPVFGAIFAWLWAGETLKAREIMGGILVLGGMVVAELESLRPGRKQIGKAAPESDRV